MLKAIGLRCEYLENPIGIGEANPRFGWILDSGKRNVVQESYHLQVGMDRDFTDVIWDTGIVRSSESAHVEYAGPELQSSTRYFYRVRITDNYKNESPWSDAAFFETGILDPNIWKARFISPRG